MIQIRSRTQRTKKKNEPLSPEDKAKQKANSDLILEYNSKKDKKESLASCVTNATTFLNKYGIDGHDKIVYLRGVSYLSEGQTKEALADFALVKNSGDNDVRMGSEWFAVLAHYQANDMEACKKGLNEIVNNSLHYYKTDAEDLLKDLN